ncbi:MAG: hypothetical protein GVY24_08260 [Planctomycetes bacterium]|jgi:hypothetical protein|nr:hypothetical protein [Planctomycetota bacterium]
MMKRLLNGRHHWVLTIGLTAGAGLSMTLPVSAQDAPAGVGIRADEAMAAVGDKSPIGLLYRAYRFEQAQQPAEAQWIYQQMIEQEGLESRWGQEAALSLTRWYLSQPAEADPVEAAHHLASLPADSHSPSFERQKLLWRLFLDLHAAADAALAAAPDPSQVDVDAALARWRVPAKVRPDAARAMALLAQRFTQSSQHAEGVAFFRELVATTSHPLIQQLGLRHLAQAALEADQPELAFAAARAYWLSMAEDPSRLPVAIDQLALAMAAHGADEELVKAFRYRQMLGDGDQSGAVLAFLQAPVPQRLFDEDALAGAGDELARARMLLLDGRMPAAIGLIKGALTQQERPAERAEALLIARMAFAFHDGHMHRIDRYETYLLTGGEDPLAALAADRQAAQRGSQPDSHGG